MWPYKHKDTDKDYLSLCNYGLKSNVGMVNTMGKLNDIELYAFYFLDMFKLCNDNCISNKSIFSLYIEKIETCITEFHCRATEPGEPLNVHKECMSLQLTSSAQTANEPNEPACLVHG